MANATTLVPLLSRPLVASDQAGLLADLVPKLFWEPTVLLESNPDQEFDLSLTALAASPDHLRVLIHPPSNLANLVFYPVAFTLHFVNSPQDAGFSSFWETGGLCCITPPSDRHHAWYPFDLTSSRDGYHPTANYNVQAALPPFEGFPIRPVRATQSTDLGNALGGFDFRVKTFDGTTKTNTHFVVDARWLGFPQAVARSAGFYLPRLWYKTN